MRHHEFTELAARLRESNRANEAAWAEIHAAFRPKVMHWARRLAARPTLYRRCDLRDVADEAFRRLVTKGDFDFATEVDLMIYLIDQAREAMAWPRSK